MPGRRHVNHINGRLGSHPQRGTVDPRSARAFSEEQVTPVINGYGERGDSPREVVPGYAALGVAVGPVQSLIDGRAVSGMWVFV